MVNHLLSLGARLTPDGALPQPRRLPPVRMRSARSFVRWRRYDLAVRGQPALALKVNDVRMHARISRLILTAIRMDVQVKSVYDIDPAANEAMQT